MPAADVALNGLALLGRGHFFAHPPTRSGAYEEALGTSQSAVNRIERGNQNISLEMIARIGE
ncbi:helix-turn-helix domain-containing protein, partial [Streptomyces sp. NPDC002172]